MSDQLFLKKCSHCRKEELHRVYAINIKRGLKLKCVSCNRMIDRYFKVNTLKPYVIEIERRELK